MRDSAQLAVVEFTRQLSSRLTVIGGARGSSLRGGRKKGL